MRVTVELVLTAVPGPVVGFIAARNGDDTQHIGYLGTDADDITDTLNDLYSDAVVALAWVGGELAGALAAEWDLDLGRTWLYGPWGEGADQLYAALLEAIPAEAAEHELYPAEANTGVADFAARNGFAAAGDGVIYELTRDRLDRVPPATAVPLPPDLFDEFAALHDRVFPRTSYGARALADRQPPPQVVLDGDRLLGYVVLRLTPEVGNGELDYLAVAEQARGRGLGRQLAAAAVHLAFQDPRMRVLGLSTNADNFAAQHIYQSIGFGRCRQMRAFRTPAAARS